MKNKVFKTSLVAAAALAVSMVAVACDGTEEATDQPEVTTYAVTYSLNGGLGTAPTQDPKEEGATFTIASADGIYKTGFTFEGWSDGTTTFSAGDTYTMPGHEVTFTAQWETVSSGTTTYTVTYELNGGSGTAPTQAPLAAGATFNLSTGTGLNKPGFTLTGWNDGEDDYSLGATYTMPADNVVLTAKWEEDIDDEPTTCTVTYRQPSPIPAGMGVESHPDIVRADQAKGSYTLEKPTTPYYAAYNTSGQLTLGYYFVGWQYKNQVYLPGQTVTLSDNATIVAQYLPMADIEGEWVDRNNNSTSMHIVALTESVGVLYYPDVIHETYVWEYFTYTVSDATENNLTATPVGGTPLTGTVDEQGNLTLTVTIGATDYEFAPGQAGPSVVTVEFSFGEYNGQDDPPTSQRVNVGEKVTDPEVDVNIRLGYTLEGWHVDTETGAKWNFETDTVTRGMTLVAKWNRLNENPKATFTKPEGATGDDPDPIEFSSTSKFPANPYDKPGYTFYGWAFIGQSNIYNAGANMNWQVDKTFVAVFGKTYTLPGNTLWLVYDNGYIRETDDDDIYIYQYTVLKDNIIAVDSDGYIIGCRLNSDGTADYSIDGVFGASATAHDGTKLELDGFGGVTLGEHEGTYSVSNSVIELTFGDVIVENVEYGYDDNYKAVLTLNTVITINGTDYVFGEVSIPQEFKGKFSGQQSGGLGDTFTVTITENSVTVIKNEESDAPIEYIATAIRVAHNDTYDIDELVVTLNGEHYTISPAAYGDGLYLDGPDNFYVSLSRESSGGEEGVELPDDYIGAFVGTDEVSESQVKVVINSAEDIEVYIDNVAKTVTDIELAENYGGVDIFITFDNTKYVFSWYYGYYLSSLDDNGASLYADLSVDVELPDDYINTFVGTDMVSGLAVRVVITSKDNVKVYVGGVEKTVTDIKVQDGYYVEVIITFDDTECAFSGSYGSYYIGSVDDEGDSFAAMLSVEESINYVEFSETDETLSGKQFVAAEHFTCNGVEFVGLQFGYNSNLGGLTLKTIYMNGEEEKVYTSSITYSSKSEDGKFLTFVTTNGTYSITIGKASDGSIYITAFTYKKTSGTESIAAEDLPIKLTERVAE